MKGKRIEKRVDYGWYFQDIRSRGLPEYHGVAETNLGFVEEKYRTELLPNIDADDEYEDVAGVEFAFKRLWALMAEGWQESEVSDVVLEKDILAAHLIRQLNEWQDYVIEIQSEEG